MEVGFTSEETRSNITSPTQESLRDKNGKNETGLYNGDQTMKELKLKIHLEKYCAAPYTDALQEKIDLEQKAGISWRTKNPEKYKATMEAYLPTQKWTWAEFLQLVSDANIHWYTTKDGYIVVPEVNAQAFIGNLMCDSKAWVVPKILRQSVIKGKLGSANCRAKIVMSQLVSDKKITDEIEYTRFIKPVDKNQKRQQVNWYVEDVTLTGSVRFHPSVEQDRLLDLLAFGVQEVGIGACRKLGWGRGSIVEPTGWEIVGEVEEVEEVQ